MVAAACPRCTGVVALHEGHPVVSRTGGIELWHRSCWAERHRPSGHGAPPAHLVRGRGVEEVTVIAPQPRMRPLAGIAAGVAVAALAVGSYSLRVKLPSASLATINFDT